MCGTAAKAEFATVVGAKCAATASAGTRSAPAFQACATHCATVVFPVPGAPARRTWCPSFREPSASSATARSTSRSGAVPGSAGAGAGFAAGASYGAGDSATVSPAKPPRLGFPCSR
ncbi:MAG: hypothetical protein IPP07_07895 [Holophagales bacterium]|nr:hypothetical protein [Holophagales bacterium]